jgi:hypothetical protein
MIRIYKGIQMNVRIMLIPYLNYLLFLGHVPEILFESAAISCIVWSFEIYRQTKFTNQNSRLNFNPLFTLIQLWTTGRCMGTLLAVVLSWGETTASKRTIFSSSRRPDSRTNTLNSQPIKQVWEVFVVVRTGKFLPLLVKRESVVHLKNNIML